MTTRQLSVITNCSETTLAGLKTYQILTKSGKTYKKYVRVTENEWIDWSKEQRLIEQIDALKRQLAWKRVAKRPLQW